MKNPIIFKMYDEILKMIFYINIYKIILITENYCPLKI